MEKREHERVPLTLPIRVRISDIGDFVEEHSANLSKGGIFIRMNYPPPAGSKVILEFVLEQAKKTVETRGEVVRSVTEEDAADGPTGIAVKFTELGKDGRRFIELVIQKYNRLHPTESIELPPDFFDGIAGEIDGASVELPPDP